MARDPEPDAAERLVRDHQVGVWRYLRSLGCSPQAAEELAQDTMILALRKGVASGPGVARWLRRSARNLWRDGLRRSERRREEAIADVVDRSWDRLGDDGGAAVDALRACLDELGDRPRQAIRLVYADGASRAEVARALGMKENGVKTLLHRARQVLRDCVQRRTS